MTRWDSDLSKTGNQAKITGIINKVSTTVLYNNKDNAFQIFNTEKSNYDVMTYSDYTGFAVHYGGDVERDIKGINVLSVDEISYPVIVNPTNITSNSFIANWYPLSDYTYFLDVSTSITFNSFITGYNNLAIINGDTFKLVTGLSSNTDYYYRVRCKNKWGDVSKNSLFKKVRTL